MNWKSKFTVFLCSLIIISNLLTYSNNANTPTQDVVPTSFSEISDGMKQVAESSDMILLLDQKNANLRLYSKKSGLFKDTKIFNGETGNETIRNTQKSDMRFSYIAQAKESSNISISSMDNYTLSVLLDGVTYEMIDNGVKVHYQVGETSITFNDFPLYISEERMNELVIPYLNSAQKQQLNTIYYRLSQGTYVRKSNETLQLGKLAGKELYSYFYELGSYTREDLEADNLLHGIEVTSANQRISASIVYQLDGNDLLVTVPVGDIETESHYPLQSIELLPYFLTGSTSDNGYLVVPDGSGALINFNNQKVSEYPYTSRFYGGDKLIGAENYKETLKNLNLPIFGMQNNDYAILGIIEKGAEIANLNATVSGMVDEFNRVSLSFVIRDIDYITASNLANFTIPKYSTDYYNDDIVIRYKFLTGNDAGYVGMAKAYQNYLLEKNELKENPVEDKAPLYVELLGGVEKKKFFLGIPYNTMEAITTFEQAEEIVAKMNEKDISNIKLIYTGISNGGLAQESVQSVGILRKLGGKKGLENFMQIAQKYNATVFPNFQLQTTNSSKGLSKKMQPSFLNGSTGEIYAFDLVTRQPIKNSKTGTRIVAGTSLEQYLNKFSKSYEKLGINNLASSDLASFISPNYKRNGNISLSNSRVNYENAVKALGDQYNLMLSDPIMFAYKDVNYITDLPVHSNRNKLVDHDIPLVQLVLSGYIPYSMEAINQSSMNVWRELMQAMETNSGLKFRFSHADSSIFENTAFGDVFLSEFSVWEEQLGNIYAEYDVFYQLVKDSELNGHEIINNNDLWRVSSYSNGTKVYLNYSDRIMGVDGLSISPFSYIIR